MTPALLFPQIDPVIFAIGRMPGWIANWKELHDNPAQKIYRPRQLYIGNPKSEWVPRHER